ncbi:MAG: small GTP-binding protein domain-containing protein [Promethearchaeota archaeon CR_4]|nr:MAG: small GTP-binding protein domain-containing protein [Candidatus Lokiarchaeota archaeon CR_4]
MMRKGYIFKVVVVGNGAVGKTSLVLRYTQHKFNENYVMTIGSNFAIAEVKLLDGELCRLQIWDLAGQAHFSFVRPPFYKGASAVILVYDVTNRRSLEELKDWKEDFSKYLPRETSLYVLANKTDLQDERVVTLEEGKNASDALGASGFWETSAKSGLNVPDVFQTIASKVYTLYCQAIKT